MLLVCSGNCGGQCRHAFPHEKEKIYVGVTNECDGGVCNVMNQQCKCEDVIIHKIERKGW